MQGPLLFWKSSAPTSVHSSLRNACSSRLRDFPDSIISSSHSSPYDASTCCSMEKPFLLICHSGTTCAFSWFSNPSPFTAEVDGDFLIFLALVLAFYGNFWKGLGDKTQTLPSESSRPHKEDPGTLTPVSGFCWNLTMKFSIPTVSFWRSQNCVALTQPHFM